MRSVLLSSCWLPLLRCCAAARVRCFQRFSLQLFTSGRRQMLLQRVLSCYAVSTSAQCTYGLAAVSVDDADEVTLTSVAACGWEATITTDARSKTDDEIDLTAIAKPTPEVLAWQLHDTGCFLVYNIATMVGSGGCRDELTSPPPLSAWNPAALDTDAWAATCKAMGGTRIVLTAKHSCGFLAWKTNTTCEYLS